jgi:hypothetical protein
MKTQLFNSEIGGTTGCTLRSLYENDKKIGIRGDAWFGSGRAVNEVAKRGHEGVFQIKSYHVSYPKDYIEATLKDAPGGIHIALEGVTRDEIRLVAVSY